MPLALLVLCLVLALAVGASPQPPQPDPAAILAQCQAQGRIDQDLQAGLRQMAASLLVRAEKAEQQMLLLQQRLEDVSK